ncbi:glycosyltransferase family 4 protein [Nannocystaceae bacterium ST9]
MNILYLHQYFVTPREAGGTRSYELARRLVAAGHRVAIVTTDFHRDHGEWQVADEAGIEVHRIGIRYANALATGARLRAFARFAAAAGERARRIGGDVVFASSTPLTIALPAIWAARRLRVPFVFEVRDLWPELPIALGVLRGRPAIAAARALERLAYREARHVVALSPGMREGVLAAKLAPERVSVIPNACDFELFDVAAELGQRLRAATPWLGDRPLLLYTGTLGRANGAGWLVELAAALRERASETCIAVIGEGAEAAAIRERARRRGVLDDNLFMLGAKPKRELPSWLSAASAAISTFLDVPALRHASANKVFDALAAGRPVLVNHRGWLAELIGERGCGLVLDRDPSRAAEAWQESLARPDWLAQAGRAARALGRERFDRDDHARALEALLTRAVAEARA